MRVCYQRREGGTVWEHLAVEELTLAALGPDEAALLCWQGGRAVVIGKHQNPWRECRLHEMARAGVPLARRISGGGAVYHDAGNLCFSFIRPRDGYRAEDVHARVLAALATLGIDAQVGPSHALVADGRKFSGSAFCLRAGKAMHHGTLLIRADLGTLRRCLGPTWEIAEARGIASVPATVMNLRELVPDLTADALCAALRESFGAAGPPPPVAEVAVHERVLELCGWDWCFGRTPRFTVQCGRHALTVERGRVVHVDDPDLARRLEGVRFASTQMLTAAGERVAELEANG